MKTPHGQPAASHMLEHVFEHVLEIRRIVGENAEDIKSIQALLASARKRVKKETQPHLDFIAEAMPALARWYVQNLDRLGHGRQIELPEGKLSARVSSQFKVEITGNKADVIQRIAEMDSKYVIVTLDLNHEAIATDRNKFRNFEGLSISLKDTLKAEPVAFQPSDKEKELLSTPLRVWTNPRSKPEGRRAKA